MATGPHQEHQIAAMTELLAARGAAGISHPGGTCWPIFSVSTRCWHSGVRGPRYSLPGYITPSMAPTVSPPHWC